ncbi:hypothetical protein C8E87_7287 [Paractinoplanes brasiliensis]|uniref:Uncharacterized protein n=1 Tax=Paractinoplanes brasiliensis TaxID=52695 RepID=A0A4R6J8Q9_9ACTN|nr:hypothetical protein C8E87_7287 [Actinoplanes brasiliensis]GID30549.1 hypothetical protein Abr02nite_55320 [Actinoplanes brasiliensis]
MWCRPKARVLTPLPHDADARRYGSRLSVRDCPTRHDADARRYGSRLSMRDCPTATTARLVSPPSFPTNLAS